MATAKKLPSGNWRVKAYSNIVKGYKSFTAPTKREAEAMALQWQMEVKNEDIHTTVYQCVDEYIKSKEKILSPASVRKYYITLHNTIDEIKDIYINDITEKQIQCWVNNSTEKYAPKSVKEHFNLVCAALRQERINLDYKSILLPRIPKSEKNIPSEEEVAKILHIIEGTNIELPVTIAITLGLRQEEISALKWSDYDGTSLYIHATLVLNKDNKFIIQERTKSEASKRCIKVDELLKERLDRADRTSEFISPMRPSSVLKAFKRICNKNNLPTFTMHEQRHGNASMMLAKGVPDKYAMQRLGQSSPNMVKNVYQHLYSSKEREVEDTMSDTFKELYSTKYSTDDVE